MDPYANMGCVLKVNASCAACKMKVMEVLGSICGTYNISIDGERGLADISGQVDPNMLLHALGRSGQHAELVRVKLQHPASRPAIPPRHSIMSSGHDGLLMNHAYDYGTHHRSYPIHDPHWYDRKPLQPGPLSTMHHPYYTSTSSFGFDNHRLPLFSNGCYRHSYHRY